MTRVDLWYFAAEMELVGFVLRCFDRQKRGYVSALKIERLQQVLRQFLPIREAFTDVVKPVSAEMNLSNRTCHFGVIGPFGGTLHQFLNGSLQSQ